MKKNQKDLQVMFVGFGLIILVIIITFLRGNFFSSKTDLNSDQNKKQSETASTEKYQTIDSTELKREISMGKNFNLLDIRSFEDYSNEHILDSVNVSIDEFPAASRLKAENPVVIITTDTEDKNIDTALKSLKDEHISNVKVLAGGITAWKKIVGSTVNFGNPKSFVDQSKVSYVENDKLSEAIKANIPTFILDVRTQQEYASGHIIGAVNVPFEELEKRRTELSPFPKIVVVGMNELQEFQASVQLYDMIFIQPFVLKGGIEGWKQKGFEMVQ